MQSKRQFYSLISGYNLIFRSSCPYFNFDEKQIIGEEMLQKAAFSAIIFWDVKKILE